MPRQVQSTPGKPAKSNRSGFEMADTFRVPAQLADDSSQPAIDQDQRADAPDEWGRQSFPASDPPQNW